MDSVRTASLDFRYNNDQKFYNWYFKEKLVWADEQYPQEGDTKAIKITEEETVKKPFFKRIFKSKEEKALQKAEKQAKKEEEANSPKVKEPKAKKTKVKKVKTKKPKKKKKKNKGDLPPEAEDETEEEEDDGFRTGSL